MADVTISALTNRQPSNSAVFPYSEGGVTYNATLNQIIPTGVIMMWSGSIASIPTGWALCNGANGTPNLQDRFIIGAGSAYNPTNTGGSADAVVVNHTHTVSDPGHSHATNIAADGVGGSFRSFGQQQFDNPTMIFTDARTTGITIASTGQSGSNANLPPYYALAYIIKL